MVVVNLPWAGRPCANSRRGISANIVHVHMDNNTRDIIDLRKVYNISGYMDRPPTSEGDMDAVLHQYLSMVPLRNFQWSLDVQNLSDLQKDVVDSVVNHPLSKIYPPSLEYRKSFLKQIMAQAEAASTPIADVIYETYAEFVSLSPSDICYKSYHIGSGNFITLKESINMITDGTTGLTTWQAALHFVEWATNKKQRPLFCGKKILELGAGIGFTGIAVCSLCYPCVYHFTDCHSKVLERLKENIKLNFPPNSGKANTAVYQLDWSSKDCLKHVDDNYDIIIATDVVYDSQINDAFAVVLSKLLSHRSRVAYITSTIRSTETYEHFCSKLEYVGLQSCVINGPTDNIFYYDRTGTTEILEIYN